MTKYEMLYLLNNDLTDEAKDAKIAKYEDIVKSMGGAVASTDKWGTKKTAYPINFKNEAYYVLMTFEADGKVVEELKRVAGIDADVVRRLITKLN
ncbi:MAG: 30S ribosomal protein S6 [Clostridia bacterium]|jgi:small subunit ribosomal protein S6|nr:30S ribosomal protein S6 [Clostridiales bacterium]MBQ3506133.1 30S ribosomal protein S6 [Clostridia bacterium]